MGAKLLVSRVGDHRYAGLVEQGKLTTLVVAPPQRLAIGGNIYKGRVAKVLPGMNAVFVHCGLDRTACLYADHLVPESEKPLNQRLREGEAIVVQVTREPSGNKGARLSMRTSLVGRLAVLTPTFATRAVSRRITDTSEKQRLQTLADSVQCDASGFIVRTAAYGCTQQALQDDIDALYARWNRIAGQVEGAATPSILHEEVDAIRTVIRDHLPSEVEAIIVDHVDEHARIQEYLQHWMPVLAPKLQLHQPAGRLFADHRVEAEVRRVLNRTVRLKSGGFLVFDHTEAMTVIDVNTGRFVGKDDVEDTILATNVEAVAVISDQLRLRNIAGLVVVDFIDMPEPTHRKQITDRLEETLNRHNSRVKIMPMNDLGLVSLSRERLGEPVEHAFRQPCSQCDGYGWTTNTIELCRRILSDAQSLIQTRNDLTGVCIRSESAVLEMLSSTFKTEICAIETREGLELTTERTESTLRDGFEIVGRYGKRT